MSSTVSVFKPDVFAGKVAFVVSSRSSRRPTFISSDASLPRTQTGGGSGICYGIVKQLMARACIPTLASAGLADPPLALLPLSLSPARRRLQRRHLRPPPEEHRGSRRRVEQGDGQEVHRHQRRRAQARYAPGRHQAHRHRVRAHRLCRRRRRRQLPEPTRRCVAGPSAPRPRSSRDSRADDPLARAGLSANAFKTVLEIDTLGTYHTFKATIDELCKTKGSILAISATLHYTATPLQAHVSAAKAGVDALIKVIGVEYGPRGVRANVSLRLSPEARRAELSATPC